MESSPLSPRHRAIDARQPNRKKRRAMNASEAYIEYANARATAWAIHDALVADGKVSCVEDLDICEGYQAAVEKEHIAWVRYLEICKASLQGK